MYLTEYISNILISISVNKQGPDANITNLKKCYIVTNLSYFLLYQVLSKLVTELVIDFLFDW